MGRTNPTFRDRLQRMERRWADYRLALRRRDQSHFDRLFAQAETHADAAGHLNAGEPLHPVLVSVLLEHEKRLAALEADADGDCEGDAIRGAAPGGPASGEGE
jgi:hypothetical protein